MTGVGVPVDDPLRLLVASSAVTLSLAWPDYKWSEVSEVLLYPDSFDRDFRIGPPERAGMAHVWGTVILSIPALWHSFDHPDENYHVSLHEFAHLLTFEGERNLAIPIGLRRRKIQEWEAIQPASWSGSVVVTRSSNPQLASHIMDTGCPTTNPRQ